MLVPNASDADTTFQVPGAVPPPELTFTSVTRTGGWVKIVASVTKASAATKVSLFFSTTGQLDRLIAADLSVASGAVSATWELTGG